ncbi:MAG: AAA family ATPase, partial [Candidatus Eremiobacteraeota bacterium]|nr:AAA family ATPase [Candidatus Eremiobacteraeota bacterium]
MPSTVDTNLARTRIQSLFRYLAELQKLKTPPKVQLKAYSWQLRLADVPDLNEVTRGEILPPTEDGEVLGDDYILKVRKPEDESGAANKLFEQFLELWQTMERESEKVELMLGEGQILWNAPQGGVDHPLLLQTLSLEFDPAVPEFTVRETDREPFLYSPLMRWCDVDEPSISEARAELQEAACHPLGGPETTEFLRKLQEKLWSDGKFIDEPSGNERAAKTVKVIRDPILYLGTRSLGFSQAIDAYLDAIPKLETFPHSLLRVVGIETPSKKQGEASDLLMTMPSNPEQERVARRLEESSCVLVQGPPGTGKTHTIANLVGHLLAQGKSILVTSHASKALRVVRDMVIPELRPLCVSVLDQEQESRRQLEQAVKGIVARFTTSDIDELDKLAQTYYDRRKDLETRLAEAQKELLEARHDEYRELIVGDDGIHPARAAKLVAKGMGTHDWIPGPVENEAPLPLTTEEFEELYQLNREVPAALEEDLETSLPALEDLLTEGDFRKLLTKREELQDADPDFGRDYWERDDQTLEKLASLREAAERVAVSVAEEGRDWALECMRVGRLGGTHQETWEDLVRAIESSAKSISANEAKVLSTGAEVKSDTPVPILLRTANEILEHLKAQKDIGWLELEVKRRHWKTFLSSAIVNGSSPKTVDDIAAVVSYLEIKAERDALKTRWERQMVPKGAPAFDQMGEQPEQVCLQYCQPMRDALDWERKVWAPFHETLKSAGLRWEAIEEKVAANPSLYGDFLRIREAIDWQLKPALKAREAALELKSIDTKIREQEQKLMGFTGGEAGSILEKLRTATANLDVEEYARAWNWMSQLYSLQETVERRNELLGQIEAVAPHWAEALRAHDEPHNEAAPPGDVDKAWKHIQWSQQLAQRHKVHFDELQQEILRLKTQLRTATAHYVENKTWANQLRRTGVRQQQALVGWLDLMRKIGSGKGKRAPRLKAMAREKLADCRDAVPVWIMPLSRLAESYHPGESMFDVVILDEASQCDVTGLLAFALGKEVLVVGDHEQVSPEAVGLSFAAIEAMIEEFLAGIPNRELYDGRTSVYDLARQSFGGTIRLLEHFRCVEEIIAFSNHLCYQGEIQPLREGTQVLIKPPTVPYRVPEATYEKKVNKIEAQTIAALVVAACEQPEYEGVSMGVISLVGEEQALAVERLLTKHLELTE